MLRSPAMNRSGTRSGEYVRGMASTNGVESFWSMLKRAYTGTFHKLLDNLADLHDSRMPSKSLIGFPLAFSSDLSTAQTSRSKA